MRYFSFVPPYKSKAATLLPATKISKGRFRLGLALPFLIAAARFITTRFATSQALLEITTNCGVSSSSCTTLSGGCAFGR